MPRSSRHKSHKQSKHSSRDVRERSDSEEDVKTKNGREEGSVRVSKDASSGDKRKLASQLRDGKDLSGLGNGDASEEYASSKRRKDRVDVPGSDRWDGGDERADGSVVDKGMKRESSRMDSEKVSKSKVSIDSKSKSSRRHDSEKEEDNVGLLVDKEESKSGKVEAKRKGEKDSSQKDASQYKDTKEKEKERGSEKDRKVQDSKRDSETRVRDSEGKRKRQSESLDVGVERQVKRGSENTGKVTDTFGLTIFSIFSVW